MTSTKPTVWRAAIVSAGGKLREKTRHIEAGKIGQTRGQQAWIDPDQVALHRLVKRNAQAFAQGVEHGAIDLRGPEIGHQRIETVRRAGGDLVVIPAGEMSERRARPIGLQIGVGREPQRKSKLVEIVLVRQRQILVEPFGRQQFGGGAPMRLPAGQLDAGAHKTLRRLGKRNHAEAKRHAQAHGSLVKLHVADEELRRGHVDSPPECCRKPIKPSGARR